MNQKYECKYGLTNKRPCLVPFSGNGRYICRLYELGKCGFDSKGNKLEEKPKLTQQNFEDMLTMIDGAYTVVELYKYKHEKDGDAPYNVKWATEWLEKARKFGVKPE